MTTLLSRRQILASGAATATVAAVPSRRASAASMIPLTIERRILEVNRKPAPVFAIHQNNGTAGAFLAPDQRFAIALANRCGEQTIVHWHGQTPPVRQDGVALTGLEPLIANGATQGYDFTPRSGTHWMHSHQGLQEQLLMAAPLVVRTPDDLRLDAQEVTVMLHDFTFRDPDEILAKLRGKSGTGTARQGTSASTMAGMNMGSGGGMTALSGGKSRTSTSGSAMTAAGGYTSRMSMSSPSMDLDDVDFDAYLANDRTLADPEVVRTEANGRVRLRLINGATSTAFWIELGKLEGQVIAVDGDPVRPISVHRFPMAEAQRVDVLLRLPAQGGAFPILAQREGDQQLTGIVIASPKAIVTKIPNLAEATAGPVDLSLEARLSALLPLSPRRPDRVHQVHLTGNMVSYVWGINGHEWPNYRPLTAANGERVAFNIVNETSMAHPMHLHGHHFQVIALNGKALAGAMRDTVLVPAKGSVRIAFDADSPGRWLFHCHNLYHMASGMMTELLYDGFTAGH